MNLNEQTFYERLQGIKLRLAIATAMCAPPSDVDELRERYDKYGELMRECWRDLDALLKIAEPALPLHSILFELANQYLGGRLTPLAGRATVASAPE